MENLQSTVRSSKCGNENYLNVCHILCLGESEHLCFSKVGDLQSILGITVAVLFASTNSSEIQANYSNNDLANQDEELLHLDSRELKGIIYKLRNQFTKKNHILSFYKAISQDIAKHRDAVVMALSFIDNISATTSSADEFKVKSIACTANPERIDEDWK